MPTTIDRIAAHDFETTIEQRNHRAIIENNDHCNNFEQLPRYRYSLKFIVDHVSQKYLHRDRHSLRNHSGSRISFNTYDDVMADQPIEARDYFLACYVVSLVQNDTILGTPIKYTTIKSYLKETHTLFKELPFESEHGFAELILKSIKNYEKVHKGCKMTTDCMM